MANYHLRDKSLSLKAKGLLSLMLSLPENWDYSEKVHIAVKAFSLRTDAQLAIFLSLAEEINIVIIGIELFLGAGDAFTGGTQVDVVLLVLVWHKKSSDFRFLETEDSGCCRKWVQETDRSPSGFLRFGLQQTRSKGSCYIQLSARYR